MQWWSLFSYRYTCSLLHTDLRWLRMLSFPNVFLGILVCQLILFLFFLYPDEYSECMCRGDPHCTTLDGKLFHYQGQCEYVMAQDDCTNGISGTPSFIVLGKFWDRNRGITRVSWVEYVTVKLFYMGSPVVRSQIHIVSVFSPPCCK